MLTLSCSFFNWKELQSAARNQKLQPFTGGNRELRPVFQPFQLPIPWLHICSPSAILNAIVGWAQPQHPCHVLCIHTRCGSLLPHQFARKTYRMGGYWPATNYKIKNLCAKWAQLHQPLLSYMQTCQIRVTSLRLSWEASEPMSKAQLRSLFFPIEWVPFQLPVKNKSHKTWHTM